MRIGIDISQVIYEGTGVSRFTKGLIDSILTYDHKNKWVFFYSGFRRTIQKEIKEAIEMKNQTLIQYRIPPKLLAGLWIKIGYTVESIDKTLDWFITSDWAEIPSKHTKKATIVHDLTYIRYPEFVEKNIRDVQTDRLKRVKRESMLIFADSYSTKKDITRYLEVEGKRIAVNYPGVETVKPTQDQINSTLQKYNLKNKKFILTVGKLEPRKNLPRLIQTFQLLNRKDNELIIVGPKGWQQFNNVAMKQSNNVRFLDLVSDLELSSLYSSCLIFVYPSLWEGFGYPIIEAMQLKAPVACSNVSSMKEIAKDAALFFNPLSVEEMYRSMNTLIQDKNLRNELIKKGLQRNKIFYWRSYYNTMLEALENHTKI